MVGVVLGLIFFLAVGRPLHLAADPDAVKFPGEKDVKQIEIQIGETVFIADLLWEEAPKTCRAIVGILPHESITYHQFWSGEGLQVHDETLKQMACEHGLWPSPNFPDYEENPSIYGTPGEVGFYAVGNGIFLTYGKSRFFGPLDGAEATYIFAVIKQDLDKLYALGKHIGRHGEQKIVIRVHNPQ